MNILLLGGTRFIGPYVVRDLVADGHSVTVFHRGETENALSDAARHIHGDRADLEVFAGEFRRLAPDVVLDMLPRCENDALDVIQAFTGVAQRVVALSSCDVYRNYDRLRNRDDTPTDPAPLTESSPLRANLFPYRDDVAGPDDWRYDYEKILVERAYQSNDGLPATILRLPIVYGPGDFQHRTHPYQQRMEDGRGAILIDDALAGWRCARGYIEDVAHAIALAVAGDAAVDRVYNVAEPDALTETQWVRRIGDAVGWNGDIVSLPVDRMPEHLVVPLDWRQHLSVDASRIRQELGYAERVLPDEAMSRTVEWERSHSPDDVQSESFDYVAEDAALAAAATGAREQPQA